MTLAIVVIDVVAKTGLIVLPLWVVGTIVHDHCRPTVRALDLSDAVDRAAAVEVDALLPLSPPLLPPTKSLKPKAVFPAPCEACGCQKLTEGSRCAACARGYDWNTDTYTVVAPCTPPRNWTAWEGFRCFHVDWGDDRNLQVGCSCSYHVVVDGAGRKFKEYDPAACQWILDNGAVLTDEMMAQGPARAIELVKAQEQHDVHLSDRTLYNAERHMRQLQACPQPRANAVIASLS